MQTDVFIELHVPDFAKAVGFYSKLGFKVLWRTEDYLVMRRRRSVLNFYGDSSKIYRHAYFERFSPKTKTGYGVEIIIPIDGLSRFYRRVRRVIRILEPLKLRRWGRRDFRVVDPFGFYLRITERYDWMNTLDARNWELVPAHKGTRKRLNT